MSFIPCGSTPSVRASCASWLVSFQDTKITKPVTSTLNSRHPGEGRDPSSAKYECFFVKPSRGWMGPSLRRDDDIFRALVNLSYRDSSSLRRALARQR